MSAMYMSVGHTHLPTLPRNIFRSMDKDEVDHFLSTASRSATVRSGNGVA